MRQQQIDAAADVVFTSSPFLRRLQFALLRHIPENEASLERAAKELSMSPRTLQRRLQDFGLTFQDVLNGAREQLARQYLQKTRLSLAEITQLLGFSSQSAFGRAFKQWAAMKPLNYRNSSKRAYAGVLSS